MTPNKPTPAPPPRLHILLAREAPVGIILRKGPTSWVQMIKWHTDTDQFDAGQWFKGTINGWNSDVSPNGELIIYLATKYGHKKDPEFWDSWTAISKPPYFTALVVWPQWGGGGLFIDDHSVYTSKDTLIEPEDALSHFQIVDAPKPYQNLWERKGWKRRGSEMKKNRYTKNNTRILNYGFQIIGWN